MEEETGTSQMSATGSIGDSTLAILAAHSDNFDVYALSGHQRLDKLLQLCQQFNPARVCVPIDKVDDFAAKLAQADLDSEVIGGPAGLDDIASDSSPEYSLRKRSVGPAKDFQKTELGKNNQADF